MVKTETVDDNNNKKNDTSEEEFLSQQFIILAYKHSHNTVKYCVGNINTVTQNNNN